MRLLRELVESGDAAFGGWCGIGNSFSAELMGRAGFDWVGVDMQHGHISSFETLVPMVQALNRCDVPALVRIPWKSDAWAIMAALDSGAQGVIVPMVDTPEEAATAAAACRYPPAGSRSWGPVRIALEVDPYTTERGNALVLCLVMIETRSGLECLDEILAVPGVDGVMVGPADLTISHGGLSSYDAGDGRLDALTDTIVAACRRRHAIPGYISGSPAEAAYAIGRGFQLANVTADQSLIRGGARAAIDEVRARRGS